METDLDGSDFLFNCLFFFSCYNGLNYLPMLNKNIE